MHVPPHPSRGIVFRPDQRLGFEYRQTSVLDTFAKSCQFFLCVRVAALCIVVVATKPIHDTTAECCYSQDIVIVASTRARHVPQAYTG